MYIYIHLRICVYVYVHVVVLFANWFNRLKGVSVFHQTSITLMLPDRLRIFLIRCNSHEAFLRKRRTIR